MRQSQNNDNIELTSGQVRQMTIETLIRHLNLTVDGYKFNAEDIWNVTVSAAAQGQAIQSAANQLEEAPDPSTVRLYLRSKLVDIMTVADLEYVCNQVLVDNLPSRILGRWHSDNTSYHLRQARWRPGFAAWT